VRLARAANPLRTQLAANSAALRSKLNDAKLNLASGSFGPIVSVILGENERVLAAAERLRAVGVLAQAIRPPTVPVGASRLRLTVKATFTEAEISRLAGAVVEACRAS